MRWNMRYGRLVILSLAMLLSYVSLAAAQYWESFENNTRYLALGDSISAGYGAHPATNGFVYQLYQSGAIDNVNNLLLDNIGVVNATSRDVLDHQLPLGALFFADTGSEYRKVVTLTVGGNDLVALIGQLLNPSLSQAEKMQLINATLTGYGTNLGALLAGLIRFQNVEVYVADQYDTLLPVPGASDIVDALNAVTAQVVASISQLPSANITLVDIHSAFEGRKGLLLIEKKGGDPYQVHPTNAGYQVIAKAFADTMRKDKK